MHVFITGASAGIGEALAREDHRRGATVTLVARRKERLQSIASELGERARVIGADLCDPKAAARATDEAEDLAGPIDVLVNNAGIQIVEPAVTTDADEGETLLALDLLTPMRLARKVLPSMIERGKETIVNVSSMAALAPVPGMFYYSAAKAGLANGSEALRRELAGTGVNVLTVYPGPVHTDMAARAVDKYRDGASMSLAPWGTTDELARIVVRAVELGQARVIYPRFYAVALLFPNVSRFLAMRLSPRLKAAA